MFKNALDRQLRFLRGTGVGVERKRASIICQDDEEKLWTSRVLGIHSPIALLNAVFYLNGKSFCLRSVSEHYNLRFSQLVRKKDPDRYIYIEHGSKNRNGGVEDYKMESKCVTIVASEGGGNRDHVFILDTYLSKIPPEMVANNERFYLRPMQHVAGYEGASWYYRQNIGQHKIQTMVKKMFEAAEIDGKYTNHSLRATGASALFNAGVLEAVIQKCTGHKSTEALRLYEHVSDEQQVAVSEILACGAKKATYEEQLKAARADKKDDTEAGKKPKLADQKELAPLSTRNPPHPSGSGATIFQNRVFNGCSLVPYGMPQSRFPDPANPVAEEDSQFKMSLQQVKELYSDF